MAKVDWQLYSGTWYEIARTNNNFEKNCDYAIAHYEPLLNGTIKVINECYNSEVLISNIEGVAYPSKLRLNALKVKFNNMPMIASLLPNYFVLYTDYIKYAIVESRFGIAWILSRTKTIPDEDYKELVNKLPKYIRSNMIKNIIK